MAAPVQNHSRWLSVALVCALLLAGCGGKKSPRANAGASAEPDKVLFERAQQDIRKGRHAIARLTLQTLINTYPDSEYLAKAALAIADSYYKEGGTANLTQAVQEYQNFITFFPFLEEATYAQMQIAMSHYRRMEKPDRDRTFARLAEEALQTFILKYPDNPLRGQAEQRLREVQEVLAEGDYRIARFYYVKGSLRASSARLLELVDRYPLYSQADRALWMLGDAFERAEHGDIAVNYYARIVKNYPLSPLVDDAKGRLTKLGVPVPQPDPEALARMQKERECDRQRPGTVRRSLGMFKTGPNVATTACTGQPNLSPPGEPTSPAQTLSPGSLNIGVAQPGSTSGTGATASSTTPVEGNPSTTSGNPDAAAKPADPSAETKGAEPAKPEVKDVGKKKKEEEDKKKKQEAEKKKREESSSKKKKGLRKIIPW